MAYKRPVWLTWLACLVSILYTSTSHASPIPKTKTTAQPSPEFLSTFPICKKHLLNSNTIISDNITTSDDSSISHPASSDDVFWRRNNYPADPYYFDREPDLHFKARSYGMDLLALEDMRHGAFECVHQLCSMALAHSASHMTPFPGSLICPVTDKHRPSISISLNLSLKDTEVITNTTSSSSSSSSSSSPSSNNTTTGGANASGIGVQEKQMTFYHISLYLSGWEQFVELWYGLGHVPYHTLGMKGGLIVEIEGGGEYVGVFGEGGDGGGS